MTELALGFNDALDLMEPRGDFITLPLVSRSPLLNIEGRPSRKTKAERRKKEATGGGEAKSVGSEEKAQTDGRASAAAGSVRDGMARDRKPDTDDHITPLTKASAVITIDNDQQ